MQTASKITALLFLALGVTATIVDCVSLKPSELARHQRVTNTKKDSAANTINGNNKGRAILLGLLDKLVDLSELLADQLRNQQQQQADEISIIEQHLDYCPIKVQGDDDSELMRYLASTRPMSRPRSRSEIKRDAECWLEAVDWLRTQLLAIRMHLLLETGLADCLLRFARLARYLEDTCADIGSGDGSDLSPVSLSWPLDEIRGRLVSLASLHGRLADSESGAHDDDDEIAGLLVKLIMQ